MGKIFIFLGLLFVLIGVFLTVFKDFPFFRLPGDIVIEKEGFSFYFPLTTSILLSVVLSVGMYLFGKFFR